MTVYYYFVSIYHLILFVAVSLFYYPLAVIVRFSTGWFDRRLFFLHFTSTVWASCYSWLSPIWSVAVTGRKNADRKKAYVMVCNHQSMLDIPFIYRTFLHFKWVSKASLFKLPIIGWNLSMNRHVRLERGSMMSQRKMFKQCAAHIQNGSSIMIFPEGTRSRNGELRAFKEGAFLLALQQKTDILPLVIDGSYKALPEKGFFPNKKQKVILNILPPIPYEIFKHMNTRELTEYIHAVIAAELIRMRTGRHARSSRPVRS